MTGIRIVSNTDDLTEATQASEVQEIQVVGELYNLPRLRLAPGQRLQGDQGSALVFAKGEDGIELTSDNTVTALRVVADPERRTLFNDTEAPGLGRVELSQLIVTGNIRLLLRGDARGGHIEANEIFITYADARGFDERPAGFGVEVVPGVFTVWNQQSAPGSRLTANLAGIRAGRPGQPVRGGGVFVCGTPGGGRTIVTLLETGEIYSDGGIAPGTSDRISSGVFVVHGAWVDKVHNLGPVTTYGPNDMVLDNWGSVEHWQAEAKITSYGPSGIGFVNFGALGVLRVNAAIETFGLGARGFNVYAGTVRDAEFERVITHTDGAVGIQIGQPIGRLAVRRGIETYGGIGDSLVKGVVKQLPAIALSVKPGGSAREITVRGGIIAHGAGIEPIEIHGEVGIFSVSESLAAFGGGFDQV